MAFELVVVRHGESQWNKENRFTGWEDVPLSDKGIQEATEGGQVLKAEGFEFDLCYTSYLRRAIKTLWIILEELGQEWLPVEKRWQLNERHYGELQGLNKSETAAKHGEEQVLIWRRSYDTPPPLLDLESPSHPRFDRRYAGVPPESLPSGESLKQTLERFIPLWSGEIQPLIRQGKKILISAHGNSLRALIQHLEGLTPEEIMKINVPTGVPLHYELDDSFKVLGKRYLGDPEKVAAAMGQVAAQGKAK